MMILVAITVILLLLTRVTMALLLPFNIVRYSKIDNV